MAARRRADREAVERLKAVPLFAGCSPRELAGLAEYLKESRFQAGRTIVKEGDTGTGMHVILEGQAQVSIGDRAVRRLGPGDFVGEIALLDRGPRTATVVAETPVRTVSLSVWNLRSCLREYPTLAIKMLEEMARRVRNANPTHVP